MKLIDEFSGENHSFLIDIRCNLKWNHEKFKNLVILMYEYCINHATDEKLDKEIAHGFWFVSHFVKEWTSYEEFRNVNNYSDEYYVEAYGLIDDLSYFYFVGDSIYENKKEYIEYIQKLSKMSI